MGIIEMSKKGSKIHLVESCSFPRATYKNVTNEASFKKLKEAAQNVHAATSKKLNEAAIAVKAKKVLKENKIDEVVQKRVLEALQEAGADVDAVELWQFPVSKINTKDDPNLNGRVYNKDLWKNVIDKQVDVWKGGTGLANHPLDDEDGDFLKQSIVWLDGFLGDDGFVYGIGTFVGQGGALARQIIGVGGRVGFSTSGYGEFLTDGITVDPESYEIDRFADLVLNPSQGVFGNYADAYKKNESAKNKKSSTNLKESKMKKQLKENEDIKRIINATKAEDAVSQLSAIADEVGLEISLKEGTEEVISTELSIKLMARMLSKAEPESVTVEDIKELKDYLETVAEMTGDSAENVKKTLMDEFKKAEVSEEILKMFDSENLEESEEVVEESEEEDFDSDMSFEDQLIVEHYTKQLKAINKKPNTFWEEKIQELENLTKKLSETKISEKVKVHLNTQAEKTINSIMKEARLAVQEGFKAREICENLGISTIAKLHNIKEKLEDYVSLEECLGKATKEANKYKALYEAKLEFAQTEAEAAFNSEEQVKQLKEEISNLKSKASADVKSLKKENIGNRVDNLSYEREIKHLREELEEVKANYKREQVKNNEAKILVQEAEKTVAVLKKDATATKAQLTEAKERIRQLSKQLTETRLQKAALSDAKQKLVKEKSELMEDITNRRKADNLEAARNRTRALRERAQRVSKVASFYDSNRMFKDERGIEEFLEASNIQNKNKYSGLKTMKEAVNQVLFSGAEELLNVDADRARDRIDVPKEDVQSLSDLFSEV